MLNVFSRFSHLLSSRSGATATIQTFLVKVIIIAINMGTGVITARVLGSEGRGQLAAMLLWPQFLAFAMTLGVPQSLLYNLKKYPDEKSELFTSALIFSTLLGILSAAVGIIFIPSWLSQYPAYIIRAAQWFMLTSPLSLLSLVFMASFEARGEFTFSNQIRYIIPLSTLFGIGLLLVLRADSPIAFSLAYLFPSVPVSIWMLSRLWPRYNPSFNNFKDASTRLLGYGVRSYGIDLLSTLSGRVGQALVAGLLSASSLGLYTVAISLSRALNTFESAIITVLLPKAAARPVPEIVALTGRAVRVSTFLTALCVIPLMLGGSWLLVLMYGAEFREAVVVFRILLVEVLLSGSNWILAQAFMAAGKPGTVTVLQGVGLGIMVPLTLLLIPTYGLTGAGLAMLGSTAVRLLFILACYPIVLKTSPPSPIINSGDVRFIKQTFLSR